MNEKLTHAIPPVVSIYIPTHNRLKLLKRAIESVKQQEFSNFEVIVVNDGSNDGTREYLEQLILVDGRFKYLQNETPKGACYSRNRAIQIARGMYITGLDDDDEFLPNRLSEFLNTDMGNFSFLYAPLLWDYGKYRKVIRYGKETIGLADLLSINNVGNQVFVEREKLLAIGGFDENMPSCQDWDTWIRLCAAFGDAKITRLPTYIMHTSHEFGRISTSKNKILGHQKIIEKFAAISSKKNKKSQQFLLLKSQGKRLSVKVFFEIISLENYQLLIKYMVSSYLTSITSIRRKLLRG